MKEGVDTTSCRVSTLAPWLPDSLAVIFIYSKCHAGCVSVLFFRGPIPFLVAGPDCKGSNRCRLSRGDRLCGLGVPVHVHRPKADVAARGKKQRARVTQETAEVEPVLDS
jgi:hypothetical protein